MCTHPVQLDEHLVVPCGRCVSCKIAHTREWSTRCLHEASLYECNSFITLTFNDEHLPRSLSLNKCDIQLFFKRFRKRLEVPFKYLAVGEYGDDKERPHYHVLLFGIGIPELDCYTIITRSGPSIISKVLNCVWPFGFNYVGDVTPQSIRYCLEYVQKQFIGDYVSKVYGSRVQPFMLCSKGLGKGFLDVNQKVIRENLGVMLHGKNVGLPRYYKKKLELTDEEKNVIHLESATKTKERYIDASLSPDDQFEDFKKKKDQLQKNLIARSATRERKL